MFSILAMNPVAINFGPFHVRWYGIIIASAVLIAVWLSMREAKRQGLNEDVLYNMILWAIPIAIISARIYYVIFQWKYYAQHLGEIIAIWDGGIAIYGALLGAGVFIYFYCKHHNLSIWQIFDIAAPTVIMAQGIGRWGNFMNQEAFGAVTSLSFLQQLHLPRFIIQQMLIDGLYRQPTFLYESIWDLTGFALLMIMRHSDKLFKRGEIFLAYVMWYSFGRFFTEGMRTDSLMLGTFRISQILSIILFFGALFVLLYRRKNDKKLVWYNC
ncbi:prolipoprotein diacylglyceryl transferase [Fructilactobacillus lindneri]|nr:prolipoprotein diacylglyceryl transferase [Fructilactobacillus lindneri]POH24491.1 prolipoprotein diacylglyceryl transferase [Fructilactobacillus lindneri DSM 20690 = JCM 11027]ANZ59769.1 prolipoprotein diacylglyceryl transferase [Fructilactobacillus lindneri]POG98437.1 prolipoprotein diacylglyceryl transferase [Fructilactobacillus lindneri]POH03836.1 prolipoprotein diacylglyceryl transferase [Fructilactobacillus lindneri]